MEWYYADENDQQISFQESEFGNLVSVGAIKPTTLVWNSTMTNWQPASQAQPAMFPVGTTSHQPQVPVASTASPVSSGSPYLKNSPSPYQAGSAPVGGGPGQPPQQDGLGIASMVCGIIGVLLSCSYGLGLLPGIAAVICGHLSKKRIAESGDPYSPTTMTTAGLIMGYISVVLSVLFIAAFIGIFVFAAASEASIE